MRNPHTNCSNRQTKFKCTRVKWRARASVLPTSGIYGNSTIIFSSSYRCFLNILNLKLQWRCIAIQMLHSQIRDDSYSSRIMGNLPPLCAGIAIATCRREILVHGQKQCRMRKYTCGNACGVHKNRGVLLNGSTVPKHPAPHRAAYRLVQRPSLSNTRPPWARNHM